MEFTHRDEQIKPPDQPDTAVLLLLSLRKVQDNRAGSFCRPLQAPPTFTSGSYESSCGAAPNEIVQGALGLLPHLGTEAGGQPEHGAQRGCGQKAEKLSKSSGQPGLWLALHKPRPFHHSVFLFRQSALLGGTEPQADPLGRKKRTKPLWFTTWISDETCDTGAISRAQFTFLGNNTNPETSTMKSIQ